MISNVLQVVSTTSEFLDQLPVSYGQLIFVKDKRCIYFDHEDGRTQYQQIITLRTEAQRQAIQAVTGFYYVIESTVLWRYENGVWIPLTEKPKKQIYFGDYDQFPVQGDEEILYISGTKMYRWMVDGYRLLNGNPQWEPF